LKPEQGYLPQQGGFKMRITHNVSAMITANALNNDNKQMSVSLQRLSTGYRINSAADDAAGLGVSENLRTQINGTAQATSNADDGISALTIAEGAANEVSSILQRMRELAVQSSSDTLTSTERGYTNDEFQALADEIDRISNVTNYNGMELMSTSSGRFGGGASGSTLWIDANETAGVDSITVTIDTLTASAIGVSASTNLSTQSNASTAISVLDNAINSVNTMRSDMGTYINRLEHAINNLSVSNTNQQSAESTIRDVDFATETTSYTKNQILVQSATAMLAQANSVSQNVLSLLQ
jgi:flagellin